MGEVEHTGAQAINRIEGRQQSQEARLPTDENLKSKFSSTFGVKAWIDDRALSRNPLEFRNDVVAVYTVFNRMQSADEAIFALNEHIVASGAPAALFRESEPVVLAMEVRGKRTLSLPLGQTTAVFGKYLGVYRCERRGCEEIYGR